MNLEEAQILSTIEISTPDEAEQMVAMIRMKQRARDADYNRLRQVCPTQNLTFSNSLSVLSQPLLATMEIKTLTYISAFLECFILKQNK